MSLIEETRHRIGDRLRRHSIRKHRSRIGWRDAPRYSDYLARCRAAWTGMPAGVDDVAGRAAEEFRVHGISSFATDGSEAVGRAMFERIREREARGESLWATDDQERGQHNYVGDLWHDFPEVESLFRGDLGRFLESFYRAHFKILHGVLYRSVGRPEPRVGSQRWHSDSGPGICINVMFYLHETVAEDGTLEALPWDASLAIYDREADEVRRRGRADPSAERRALMVDYYDDVIPQRHADRIVNPSGRAGLIVPFLNNTLHRGGYPAPGRTRTAIVFHCYPSHLPTDFGLYARKGIGKTVPYPRNPAEEF